MNRTRLAKTFIVIATLFTAHAPARSQEEARAAWQVLQFDITASLPAPAAERTLTARAILTARNVGTAAGRTFTARVNRAAVIKSATVNDATATFTKREEPRTQLQQVTVTLPAEVAPGATFKVAFDYSLPVAVNGGLAAVSVEGAQFLPLSFWYPAPNTPFSPRGADSAPLRLTVNAAGGETVVSTGQQSGATFDQKLSVQPFFVAGAWDAVEGANDARGVAAFVPRGATADERKHAQDLIALAAAARAYFASTLGGAMDAPVRMVAVNRAAGFDMGGTILVEPAAFRRAKTDATVALLVAESVARLWIGGATALRGEGAGVIREGLVRHLALQFLEKQFGAQAADAERLRERIAFAAIAKHDAPLSTLTTVEPNYLTLVADKGAMIWRLAERSLGRDAFLGIVRAQLQSARTDGLTLAGFRAALASAGGAQLKSLLDAELDQPTLTDLMIGLPQQRAGASAVALRNTGTFDVSVTVVARSNTGARLTSEATIKASDFGEAILSAERQTITSVEIDPDKLYPQVDFDNDEAPRRPALDTTLDEATRSLTAQDYPHAEQLARDLTVRQPLMQDARILLARALLEENKLPDAEREFRAAADSALPLPATLAWSSIGLGEIALRKGQPAEAARLFTEAVRAEGGYPPTLAARAARLRAESTQGASAPAVDEQVRAFIAQLDQAIKNGRKAEIDALIAPGELANFEKGIVGSQPEIWQTKVLHTEQLGGDRIAADVQITARTLGKDSSGTAVYVLTRAGGRLLLIEIPIFEVH
jgi:tetratricopeptide (TPR) repeat protein